MHKLFHVSLPGLCWAETLSNSSFIHQLSSWSPLQTSLETMRKLLTGHKVSPDFLEALYAFGAKLAMDDDVYFNLCYHRTYSSSTGAWGSHHGKHVHVLCPHLLTYLWQRHVISYALSKGTEDRTFKIPGHCGKWLCIKSTTVRQESRYGFWSSLSSGVKKLCGAPFLMQLNQEALWNFIYR